MNVLKNIIIIRFFLQCLSLFNMTSPVISLLAPLFFLIMPIILLKIQGVPFSAEVYVTTLKLVFQKHHIVIQFEVN